PEKRTLLRAQRHDCTMPRYNASQNLVIAVPSSWEFHSRARANCHSCATETTVPGFGPNWQTRATPRSFQWEIGVRTRTPGSRPPTVSRDECYVVRKDRTG